MRIGIDARELCGQPTGVGRYLRGLLTQWARSERARRHEFTLYAHEPFAWTPGNASPARSAPQFATHIVPGSGGTWWEQTQLARAVALDQLDVFFAPGYTAPLRRRTPLVVAIHDVSFAAHPEWFTAREGLRRRLLSRRAAAGAAAVITISEFSRGELVEQLGVRPERIRVIAPGIDAVNGLHPRPPGASGSAHALYVGSIFNRRHIPDLVAAFSMVARAHANATLDLVGDNRTYPQQNIADMIEHAGLSGRIEWRRYVTEPELTTLYQRSQAFAFLSEYEGLGLTPLEALAAGIPAVLLDTPVARESCGAAALYVQNGDIPAIASALEQLLFDEPVRKRLMAAAGGVLSRFNWPDAAERTLAVLEASAAWAS